MGGNSYLKIIKKNNIIFYIKKIIFISVSIL
nr:MAG TPA_asm: hypothetical protein [Caudoviricetes sp.]